MTKAIIDGACGRMGKMIIQTIDQTDGIELVGAVEYSEHPDIGKDAGVIAGVEELDIEISDALSDLIDKADVVIEFTTPEATLENLCTVADAQKAMVIATTGYTDEQMDQLHALAEQISCVMAPNMSIGVNILLRLVREAAKALGDDYDIEIIEAHHNQKKDSPSGTALKIAEVLTDVLNRKLDEVGVYGRKGSVGKRTREEIGIHAVRGGDIVGDHTVLFAGSGERLEIVHRAQSRQTFANGAVRAAKWVVNAPKGLHDIKEVLFRE